MPQEGITIKEDQTLLNARFTGKQTRVFYNPFSEMRYVTESCLNFTSFKEDVWVLLAMWQKRLLPIINKIAPFHLIFELCIFGMLFGAAMLSGGGAIPLAIVGAIWGAAFGILEFVAISVHHKVIQHAGSEGCFIGVPFMYIHDQWTNDFLEIDITNTQTMVAAGVDTERGSALLAIAQKRQMVKFKVMLYGTGWGGRYMTKRWMNCFTAFMRFTCGVASAFFSFLYACGAGDVTHVLGFGLCGWCWFIILAEIGWAIWKFMH